MEGKNWKVTNKKKIYFMSGIQKEMTIITCLKLKTTYVVF